VVGKQTIKDLGKMAIERMKTFDDKTLEQSKDFISRAGARFYPPEATRVVAFRC
jgi:hypothetical protein